MLVPAIIFLYASQLTIQAQTHGTVNIAMGNGNGMVLVTDSKLTGTGKTSTSAKMLQIDDQTICSVAGLYTAGDPRDPIGYAALGVLEALKKSLADYRNRFPQGGGALLPFADKMDRLSSMLQFYLETNARASDALSGLGDLDNHELQVLMVGFEGKEEKIGKIVVKVDRFNGNVRAVIVSNVIESIKSNFHAQFAGLSFWAEEALRDCSLTTFFEKYPPISSFCARKKAGRLEDMSIQEMRDLSVALESVSASHYPGLVGDPQQVATLEGGSVEVDSPFRSEPIPQIRLNMFDGGEMENFGRRSIMSETPQLIFNSSIKRGWVSLTKSYFFRSHFDDVVLYYDGGKIDLNSKANEFTNCHFVVGPHLRAEDQKRIADSYGANLIAWKHLTQAQQQQIIDNLYP